MKRTIMAAALAPLLLCGCLASDPNFFHGAFAEAHGRAVNARQYRADVKACGLGPGSEWCRIAADDGNVARSYPLDMNPPPKGVSYVYDASQCDGVFEHGMCVGPTRPRPAGAPVCHGQIIDGVCAGPIF